MTHPMYSTHPLKKVKNLQKLKIMRHFYVDNFKSLVARINEITSNNMKLHEIRNKKISIRDSLNA